LSDSERNIRCEKALKNASIHPNSAEIKLLEIIKNSTSGWKYVGDGSFWIHRKNPDFLNESEKKLIEFNGCYFHNCKTCFPKSADEINQDLERISLFKQSGYGTLIIWEHDLKNEELIRKMISDFANE